MDEVRGNAGNLELLFNPFAGAAAQNAHSRAPYTQYAQDFGNIDPLAACIQTDRFNAIERSGFEVRNSHCLIQCRSECNRYNHD